MSPYGSQLSVSVSQQLWLCRRNRIMNLTRRLQVTAGVLVASTAAGATAGLLVAGLMLATKVGHASPSLIRELIALGSQSGALFGALLGPPVVLGLLRRVPIGRVVTSTVVSAAYGGAVGFALSLAFAEPRPTIPLILSGSIVGCGLAALHLWSRIRRTSEATSVPFAG